MKAKRAKRIKHKRFCYACGSDKTYVRKSGLFDWFVNIDANGKEIGVICSNCRQRMFQRTARKAMERIRKAKELYFKTKAVRITYTPRIGVCNWCRAVIPFDTKSTHMHHEAYHDDDPVKDAIELCVSCHRKETIRLKQMQILRDKKGKIAGLIYNK
jgi:hypothetical protein